MAAGPWVVLGDSLPLPYVEVFVAGDQSMMYSRLLLLGGELTLKAKEKQITIDVPFAARIVLSPGSKLTILSK